MSATHRGPIPIPLPAAPLTRDSARLGVMSRQSTSCPFLHTSSSESCPPCVCGLFVCFFCNSRFSVITYSAIGEPFYCYKHPRLLPCTPHARFCKISVVFGSLLAPAFRINLYLNRSRAPKTLQLESEPIWLHEISLNNPQEAGFMLELSNKPEISTLFKRCVLRCSEIRGFISDLDV